MDEKATLQPHPQQPPFYKRKLFLITAGGLVAAAIAIGLGVGVSRGLTSSPSSSSAVGSSPAANTTSVNVTTTAASRPTYGAGEGGTTFTPLNVSTTIVPNPGPPCPATVVALPRCGDGICTAAEGEACNTCPRDCGICRPYSCCEGYCTGPNCHCASATVPGGLNAADVPQFVMVTFDDALYRSMWTNLAEELVMNVPSKDATGCAPRMTWYLTNDGTDYALLSQVHARGHEIAVHTIDHVNPATYTTAGWVAQTAGARDWTLRLMGGGGATGRSVPTINGFRAPWLIFLEGEWQALYNNGFLYEASIIERSDSPLSRPGSWIWPYTIDFGSPQNCLTGTCPNRTYPGLWEVPMIANLLGAGTSLESEMDPALDGPALFNMLKANLDLHYNGNRAPFGLFLHGTWLNPTRVAVLKEFYAYAATLPNVIFATPQQIIAWMQNPVPLAQTLTMPIMACPVPGTACVPKTCRYTSASFNVCNDVRCPVNYPATSYLSTQEPSGTAAAAWPGTARITIDPYGTTFCANLYITNTGTFRSMSWTATVTLTNAAISSMYAGRYVVAGTTMTVTPDATGGYPNVDPGAEVLAAGFCGSNTAGFALANPAVTFTLG